jgi:hypothetical protein
MAGDAVPDLKAFVPAKDHGLSKQSYTDLGVPPELGQRVGGRISDRRFPLPAAEFLCAAARRQPHDASDGRGCRQRWQQIERAALTQKYAGIMAKPPALQPWGCAFCIWVIPAVSLWHIADRRVDASAA